MTILGAVLDGPERCVLWADTATYRDDRTVAGRVLKLSTNPVASTVGIGGGSWGALAREAHHAVAEAVDFDELIGKLPKRLRSLSGAIAEKRHDPREFGTNIYATAGLSREVDRILIYAFDAQALFYPVVGSRFGRPWTEELDAFRPRSPRDVVRLARIQAGLLLESGLEVPGDLVIAELTRDHVSCVVVRDFEAEREPLPVGEPPIIDEELCRPGTSPFFTILEPEPAELAAD